MNPCQLFLQELTLQVSLGCLEEEKRSLQTVVFDIQIDWVKPPLGCTSDALADTLCYATLVHLLEAICQSQHFHLIEHLAKRVHTALSRQIPDAQIRVGVTKQPRDLSQLHKGVRFVYG